MRALLWSVVGFGKPLKKVIPGKLQFEHAESGKSAQAPTEANGSCILDGSLERRPAQQDSAVVWLVSFAAVALD